MKNILKSVIVACLFSVPFLVLYVDNDFFSPDVTGKNFGFRIVVDIAFAGWLVLALYDAKYRPKISGIVLSFAVLLVVMLFANLFGAHPRSSFWSNLGRMDGYITLVHTFMYMLVLGSVLQTRQVWDWLLDISLAIAVLVAFYGLVEYIYIAGESRIQSTLGNAGFLAIYMLFHIFFAFWLLVKSKSILGKTIYGSMAALFTFIMIETGTRGTFIGLIVGVMVMSAYIAIFNKHSSSFRKFAIGASVLLVAGAGTFFVVKGTNIIQNDGRLARIANISLEDLGDRIIIWSIAWEGVKEKPVLGYGQNNFNYVYNKYYDPRLYKARWFDRTHNFILEWLITGGLLGLIIYLSIFAWCAWYLLRHPVLDRADKSFNTLEQGVLLGILAAYLTQSLVTFDTLISYIFLAITLALITSRVGEVPEKISRLKIESILVTRFATPVVIVILISSVYLLHLPGIISARELKNAVFETDSVKRLEAFDRALEQDSFAHQDITENLSVLAAEEASKSTLSGKMKQRYFVTTEQQITKLISEKPGDALIHYHAGNFYRITRQLEKASEQMNLARQLSPLNQKIIIYQGFIALAQYKVFETHDLFKTAFELDEKNLEARIYYASSLLYLQKPKEAIDLMDSDEASDKFADSSYLIDVAERYGHTEFESELFAHRAYAKSNDRYKWNEKSENWTRLAYLYYELDKKEAALVVLRDAREKLPSMKVIVNCYVTSIESDRDPKSDCQF
jgi:O-antigen ligase